MPQSRLSSAPFAAALIVAAAPAAYAQSCIWTYQTGTPSFDPQGVALYHTGLRQVLFLESVAVPSMRTWAWDGAAWTVLDSNGPTPRHGFAAAYDSARDRVVVFGGQNSAETEYLADTWEWDRTTWSRVAQSGPTGRAQPAMTYDESRQRTILFGGVAAYPTYFGDTWEWDGASWALAASAGPSPRHSARTAYDSLRARTVLCGGSGPNTASFSDLWEWDGVAWVQLSGSNSGSNPRWMVFDPARARMIVSFYYGSLQSGTWELDPATVQWQVRAQGINIYGPAAFDIARSRAVALSGSSLTYEYDGAASIAPPAILRQPSSASVPVGGTIAVSVDAAGTSPLFQWYRGGQPLSDDARISGSRTASLTISPAQATDSGTYWVQVANACWTIYSGYAYIGVHSASGGCYANCDGSTIEPFLNVNDFVCFLNAFAAGDLYADCDHSTSPPVLNVLDFACFINMFVAGCSAP